MVRTFALICALALAAAWTPGSAVAGEADLGAAAVVGANSTFMPSMDSRPRLERVAFHSYASFKGKKQGQFKAKSKKAKTSSHHPWTRSFKRSHLEHRRRH
jgi:hypothetical protein